MQKYDEGLFYKNPKGFKWIYHEQRTGIYNPSNIQQPCEIKIIGSVGAPKIIREQTNEELPIRKISDDTFIVDILLIPGKNDFVFRGTNPQAEVIYKGGRLLWH